MKNKIQNRFKIFAIAFAMVFGLVLISTTSAQAQWDRNDRQDRRNDRRDDRDDRYDDDDDRYENRRRNDNRNGGFYRDIARRAYSDGLNEGAEDARSGRRPNAQRAAGRAMRNIRGNNDRYGNQGQLRQAYRDAFMRGYDEGYRRSSYRRNRPWGN
jgi:hypothetical protein